MAEDAPGREPTLRVLTTAENEPEASLICQRLADEDIPATQQRSIGGPEWGESGARYVYVRQSDLDRARDVLGIVPTQQTQPKKGKPIEIPVPKRASWERVLRRAAQAMRRPKRDEQHDDDH